MIETAVSYWGKYGHLELVNLTAYQINTSSKLLVAAKQQRN